MNSKPETALPTRLATAADISTMMEIERHAATAGHWSREQYDAVLAGEPPADSASLPRVSLALIIEEQSAVAGFLIARAIGSEWELENVVVDNSARGRGFGFRLVGELIERARAQGGTAIFLEVRETNRSARRIYEKWGFVESGLRQRYYSNPEEAAVLYRREIP